VTTRRSFNTKRKLCPVPNLPVDLAALARRVAYGGNPEHKRSPGDFGLTPPSAWRPDKALCDGVGVVRPQDALKLLRKGICHGMISPVADARAFPRNIWSVTDDGIPLEAQLENPEQGIYHGCPLPREDPMYAIVVNAWRLRQNQNYCND
jgi:hypothetical protein